MERATGVESASAGWKTTAQPALPDTLNERMWQPRLESNQRASVLETEPAPPPRGRLGGRGDSNSDLPIHSRASCQLNDRPHNGALRRRRADFRSLQRNTRCASLQRAEGTTGIALAARTPWRTYVLAELTGFEPAMSPVTGARGRPLLYNSAKLVAAVGIPTWNGL
jgi:hypothetical protein